MIRKRPEAATRRTCVTCSALAVALLGAGAEAGEGSAPAVTPQGPARRAPPTTEHSYETSLPTARFGTITVYIPDGSPRSVAIFLSGDGGWELGVIGTARALVTMGAVVIGVDVRAYLGSLRRAAQRPAPSCQMIAVDFEASSHQVQNEIGLSEYQVPVLIGYSSGADVLPFVVNRLPADLKQHIASVSLLGIDAHASFEVRIADWVGSDEAGAPTRPELAHLGQLPVLCIYGEGESDSICPQLTAPDITREQIGRGHHFSGEYAHLAEHILAFAASGR